MLSNVHRKKSLRQNNSIWLNIRVGEAGVSILWRASVRLRREDGIRWGSSTDATLFDLFRGAGLNFYRQGQPRNTPMR